MISIIVPVYNAEKYLDKCINSILKQTYPAWELILVDNGSEDNSYRICQQYAKQDERILVLHQYQNRGVSVARNLALEKASGEYLTFVDADDWIEEDYLEHLIKLQKNTKTDMVVCQYQKVYDADRTKECTNQSLNKEEMSMVSTEAEWKEYFVEQYLERCLLEGYTHCWGVLYRTRLIEELRFPIKMTIGEDMLFLIDAVLQAKKIIVTPYVGYNYYINEQGAMNRKFTTAYMDQIVCWQQAMDKLLGSYPTLQNKLESILVVSAMLVAGKLAVLDKEEQKAFEKEGETAHEIVRKYGRKNAVQKLLPSGYLIKVLLYDYVPNIYMMLYGRWKKQ